MTIRDLKYKSSASFVYKLVFVTVLIIVVLEPLLKHYYPSISYLIIFGLMIYFLGVSLFDRYYFYDDCIIRKNPFSFRKGQVTKTINYQDLYAVELEIPRKLYHSFRAKVNH